MQDNIFNMLFESKIDIFILCCLNVLQKNKNNYKIVVFLRNIYNSVCEKYY